MLPEETRLRTDYDFRRVKKQGATVRTPYFILLYYLRDPKYNTPSRFGFIASKKFDKRAVKRNRARRLMREVIRTRFDNIQKGYDVVLIARPLIKNANFKDVNSAFNKILSKVPFA
jgi:ribonuclease P protein component